MTAVVLILTPGSNYKRFIERSGDLFDTAFVDTVRTLDGRGAGITVLVPWAADLTALIAAATLDTAPGFDPERGAEASATRSRIVPYIPPGEAAWEIEDVFWRASHVSLSGLTPTSLEQALGTFSAIHIVILGPPRRMSAVRKALRGRELQVLTFGSLLDPLEAARAIGVERSGVVNLEERLPGLSEDKDLEPSPEVATERSPEHDLERYVPFGLLLQDAFDTLLLDDDDEKY